MVPFEAEDPAAAETTVARIFDLVGRLDVPVNNAGCTLDKSLTDTGAAAWDAVMAINARGNFLHAREAVRVMAERGGCPIVGVASIISVVELKETAAYAASKGAIAQLTQVIAVEYGDRGVRANAVAAGNESDILEGIVADSRATLASYGPAHSLGRVAQARDVAEVIAFLAAPASSPMTGTLVVADGGYAPL